jgi:hypothetical protein
MLAAVSPLPREWQPARGPNPTAMWLNAEWREIWKLLLGWGRRGWNSVYLEEEEEANDRSAKALKTTSRPRDAKTSGGSM